jgi:drug/metabolite transporter (DMT)-like permease
VDRRSWAALLAIAAIWGASYLFIKIALRDFDPVVVSWARVALGVGVLVPFAWASGALAGLRSRAWMIGLVGLIQVVGPFVLIAWGEEEISSALAGILVASTPVFAALLAFRWDPADAPHGSGLIGVAVGLAGVGLLLGVDLGGSGDELLGGLAVVLASLGYAVGGYIVRLRLSDVAPLGVATGVLVAASLILLPSAAFLAPDETPGAGPVAALLALGIAGTGLAFAIFYWLVHRVGPGRTFVVTYLAPAFAVVYGATLLSEEITLATVGGLVLVIGGSWLAAGGLQQHPPPESTPGGASTT